MKTLTVHDRLNHEHTDILVIDEVIVASPDSLEELSRMFPEESDVPILMIGGAGFRSCSMFYRLKTPFEIAEQDHEVFRTPGRDKEGGIWYHNYNGPELIARLSHSGEVQIIHYPNNQNNFYPEEKAETWNIVFGNYAVLLPTAPNFHGTRYYPMHFIIGKTACKNQLELWGIHDVGAKTEWGIVGGKVIGHVDGLL